MVTSSGQQTSPSLKKCLLNRVVLEHSRKMYNDECCSGDLLWFLILFALFYYLKNSSWVQVAPISKITEQNGLEAWLKP
jgi:hypothetical protein